MSGCATSSTESQSENIWSGSDAVREILTSNGRTPAQGALAWIWARSDRTIPIPGFKTVTQAEENARALDLGPLTDAQLREIETLLGRQPIPTSRI